MGFTLSSIIGVSVGKISELLGIEPWIQIALAVSLAIVGMNVCRCVHPPGGAAAAIAVMTPAVRAMGWGYVLTCLGGALISVIVGVLGNNLHPSRSYPFYWLR